MAVGPREGVPVDNSGSDGEDGDLRMNAADRQHEVRP